MTTVNIAAVGDILMWRRQIAAAKLSGKTSYSFSSMFREVAPYLQSADLTIANLETTLSGREDVYQRRNAKTGWPMFNCPDELARALKSAGVDVVTTANNHCMDRGVPGLRRTLDVLDEHGLKHTGTYRTYRESQQLLVQDVKGIRIGILSYTYGTNLIPVPKHVTWSVNRIQPRKILMDMARLRKRSDMTIVVLHFGQEFHRFPNEMQKSFVQQLFSHGADLVFGVHPHVLQPMELKNVRDRHGRIGRRFVIYSLGNFISDRMMGGIHSDSGVIVNVSVQKTEQGVVIQNVKTIPTWVHKYSSNGITRFRVLPVSSFLRNPDGKLSGQDLNTMKNVRVITRRHLKLKSR